MDPSFEAHEMVDRTTCGTTDDAVTANSYAYSQASNRIPVVDVSPAVEQIRDCDATLQRSTLSICFDDGSISMPASPRAEDMAASTAHHQSATIPLVSPAPADGADQRRRMEKSSRIRPFMGVLRWWIPELAASALSVVATLSIIIVLKVYDHCAVTRLSLPFGFTLNGTIALLATVGRMCLGFPVSAALLQEMWLYFEAESKTPHPKSRLRDVELFFSASYGTIGSLSFLTHASSRK